MLSIVHALAMTEWSKLRSPVSAELTALAPAESDNIIDIDQRDELLAAIAAAPLDSAAQQTAWKRLRDDGANLATIHAATKIAYKLPTAELVRRPAGLGRIVGGGDENGAAVAKCQPS